jgi:hypothetical protein
MWVIWDLVNVGTLETSQYGHRWDHPTHLGYLYQFSTHKKYRFINKQIGPAGNISERHIFTTFYMFVKWTILHISAGLFNYELWSCFCLQMAIIMPKSYDKWYFAFIENTLLWALLFFQITVALFQSIYMEAYLAHWSVEILRYDTSILGKLT